VELLKERGVPVVEATDLAVEDYTQVTFATVWKPKPFGLLAAGARAYLQSAT